MAGTRVTYENFARAETDRMFADLSRDAGGVNRFRHNREPTRIEDQTVIRMNRDTLYSFAVVDLAAGATVTIPDSGGRYLSVMIVNEDHYINRVFHAPGRYQLTIEELDTRYVVVAARTLVDPADPADVAAANQLQDGLQLEAGSAEPFTMPSYDADTFAATRAAVLELATGLTDISGAFGRRDEVDPVRHLLGTAAGWGGLPDTEAVYVGVDPRAPVGEYRIEVGDDVPVDAFWSISVYNADGFFEPNESDAYSVNSITGVKEADGTIVVHLGGDGSQPNTVPITEGWNYIVRLYRPRSEVLDGSWTFPGYEPVT